MSGELKRKAFHLLCLVYVVVYGCLSRPIALGVMGGAGILILFLEGIRRRYPAINNWAWERFGSFARPWEKEGMTGIFWTWLGSILTMGLFVRREIVLAALGFMIFGDAAAALAGTMWGRHPWPGRPGKSFEGTFAFTLAATLFGVLFLPLHVAFGSAVAAAWVESRPLPWDDNLWIPILSGACMNLLGMI